LLDLRGLRRGKSAAGNGPDDASDHSPYGTAHDGARNSSGRHPCAGASILLSGLSLSHDGTSKYGGSGNENKETHRSALCCSSDKRGEALRSSRCCL
jgi:hypothetical protein